MNALALTASGLPAISRPAVPATPLPRIRGLVLAGSALAAVFVFGAGLWAAYAPLESAAHATGVVEVASSRKTVQHLEGGIVGAILVHDGERVAAGQPLIRLDDTKARTTLAALQGQYWDTLASEARFIAEIVGLRAQENAARERVALINEEIAGIRELLAKGLERKPRLLSLQRDLAEIGGKRGETMAAIARAQQTIAESQVTILNQQNDMQNEVAGSLRDAQKKLHELREQMQAASDVLARIEVRAPEDGIVTDLHVHTPGGVVSAGEPLLDLVPPEARLVVSAQIRPEDIDAVRAGLPALIRLTPYKQRRTPMLEGTVDYLSADRLVDKHTNQPYYAAKIRVDEVQLRNLADVEMIPGMPAEVMIKTGKTTVAMYALSPVLDSFHRAFHEK